MIKWYDYVIAVIVADFMRSSFLYAMSSEIWYMSLFSSIAVVALWDFWKQYCEFRKGLESKK